MANTQSGTQSSGKTSQADAGTLLTQAVMVHQEAMLRIAKKYPGRALTAEDIVQDAFVVACTHPERLKEVNSAAAWLVGITRNLARQASRKRNRRGRLLRQHFPPHSGTRDPEPIVMKQRVAEVLQAAEILPHGQRETLRCMLLHGMSDDEIATSLGVAEATVRSYRFRAIRKLRQAVG